MKYGKILRSLSSQIEETLPEWKDKFLSYKELKKHLKDINPIPIHGEERSKRRRLSCTPNNDSNAPSSLMTREESDFIRLLEAELDKFNSFFEDKEEIYIIRQKELQDQVAKAKDSNEELMRFRKEIVDFHGEMVLLENYSALNYTGLVKILKKYDKRTGALIRLPFIQRVLREPFVTTDLLYELIRQCEVMLDHLFPASEKTNKATVSIEDASKHQEPMPAKEDDDLLRGSKEVEEIDSMGSIYLKNTVAALEVLKKIRGGSSTVSVFSLPPLQANGLEEKWNKIPVLEEQVAK